MAPLAMRSYTAPLYRSDCVSWRGMRRGQGNQPQTYE